MPRVEIFVGDWVESLRKLPDESVNCVVTSPPFYGLRNYNVEGQLGLEKTPEEFVTRLVSGFREVKRVLRQDGTLWVNLGDSYNAAGRTGQGTRIGCKQGTNRASAVGGDTCRPNVDSLKPKDLIGIPWRVAFALQLDGWYLRQDIIWHKSNPMPESVKDRCTKSHEYIFLLSKSEKYYFDSEAIKEPATSKKPSGNGFSGRQGGSRDLPMSGGVGSAEPWNPTETRNRHSVWNLPTKPFKGAHFATFPPKLIEPCILAGCPVGGVVLDPFGGAGTTGVVASQLGRNAILIELNFKYAAIASDRIRLESEKG